MYLYRCIGPYTLHTRACHTYNALFYASSTWHSKRQIGFTLLTYEWEKRMLAIGKTLCPHIKYLLWAGHYYSCSYAQCYCNWVSAWCVMFILCQNMRNCSFISIVLNFLSSLFLLCVLLGQLETVLFLWGGGGCLIY